MYLKQGDYENAVQTLSLAKIPSTSEDSNLLTTISLVRFPLHYVAIYIHLFERYSTGTLITLRSSRGSACVNLCIPLDP